MTTTHTAETLNIHYDRARAAIDAHRRGHDRHREAAAATDGADRGRSQAQADMAAREWERALGAADAIEQLADALGVDLAHDRRARA